MTPKEKFIMAYGMIEAICTMLPDKFTSKHIENPAKEILSAVRIKLMINDNDLINIVNELNNDSSAVYRMVIDTYKEKTDEITSIRNMQHDTRRKL